MPAHPLTLPDDLRALLSLVEQKCCDDLIGITMKLAEYQWLIAAQDERGRGIDRRIYAPSSWETQIYLLRIEYIAAQYKALDMLVALRFMAL
jgi:hypothetical protein